MFMKNLNDASHYNGQESHDMSHDNLVLTVHAQHRCFVVQRLTLDDLHEIHPGMKLVYVGIFYTSSSKCCRMMLFVIKRIKCIDAFLTCIDNPH